MDLHGSTAYPQALREMGLSDARDYYASRAFASYRANLEGRQKVTMAILTRFDNVIRGMNALAKMLGRRK